MYVTVCMVIMVYVLYVASTNLKYLCIGFYTCRWHKSHTHDQVDHENAPGMIFYTSSYYLHRREFLMMYNTT